MPVANSLAEAAVILVEASSCCRSSAEEHCLPETETSTEAANFCGAFSSCWIWRWETACPSRTPCLHLAEAACSLWQCSLLTRHTSDGHTSVTRHTSHINVRVCSTSAHDRATFTFHDSLMDKTRKIIPSFCLYFYVIRTVHRYLHCQLDKWFHPWCCCSCPCS